MIKTNSSHKIKIRKSSRLISFVIKFLLLAVSLVIIVVVSAGYLLNSKIFYEYFIPKYVERVSPDVFFTHFEIAKGKYSFPGELDFEGMKTSFVRNNRKYDFLIKQIKLNLFRDGLSWEKGKIRIFDLSMGSKVVVFEHLNSSFMLSMPSRRDLKISDGSFDMDSAIVKSYRLNRLSGVFSLDDGNVRFNDVHFYSMDGEVAAEVSFKFDDGFSGHMKGNFLKVDPEELAKINPTFFSKIKGKVDGDIEADFRDMLPVSVKGKLSAPFGAFVRARLLKQLLAYLPVGPQKNKIVKFIKENREVEFQEARVDFRSLNENSVSMDVDLLCEDLNLDVNLTIDINLKGGLDQFLFGLRKLAK